MKSTTQHRKKTSKENMKDDVPQYFVELQSAVFKQWWSSPGYVVIPVKQTSLFQVRLHLPTDARSSRP